MSCAREVRFDRNHGVPIDSHHVLDPTSNPVAAWDETPPSTCSRGGVRLTGTDAWSWDAPFVHTAARFAEEHDPSVIWEGHRVGRDIGYCHLEKLNGLEQLPDTGFEVSCFPVKIQAASAGWTRAVAIMDV